MNWSKIKTILIGILIITNAILLFQLLTKTRFERSNSLEDVLKLYEAKGIGIEVKFGHGALPAGEASSTTSDPYRNIAYIHVGDRENGNQNVDSESPLGTLVVRTVVENVPENTSETGAVASDGNAQLISNTQETTRETKDNAKDNTKDNAKYNAKDIGKGSTTDNTKDVNAATLIPAVEIMYVDLDAIPEKLYGYSAVRHVFSDAHVSGIADELNKQEGEFTIDMNSQSLNVYHTGEFSPEFDESFEGGEMYQMSENERAAFAAEAMNMLRIVGLGGLEILDIEASKFYDVDWSAKSDSSQVDLRAAESRVAETQGSVHGEGKGSRWGTTGQDSGQRGAGNGRSDASGLAAAQAGERRHTYTVCRLYKSLQPDGGIDTESGIFVVFSGEGQLLGIFIRDLMAIVGASERPYDIIPVHEALFKALDRVKRGDVLKRFRIVFKLNDESIPADDIVRGEMLPYYELCFLQMGRVHIRATK